MLRRVVVARLGGLLLLLRRILVAWLLLLRGILIARLLRGIPGARGGVAARRLLRVNRRRLRTRCGVQAVAAAILAVALSRIIITGGVLPVEETAGHLAHATAKLGQKLKRALVLLLGLGLLRVAVAWGLLLISRRWSVLLRITTLRLGITLGLLIVALLLCHGRRGQDDGSTPTQSQ